MAAILSYQKLKIAKWEHAALIQTRDMLAAGNTREQVSNRKYRKEGALFNMNLASEVQHRGHSNYHCGTVACIGGWMHLIDSVGFKVGGIYSFDETEAATEYVNSETDRSSYKDRSSHSEALSDLFFPNIGSRYEKITQKDAVIAIDKFLTTGEVDWSHVK